MKIRIEVEIPDKTIEEVQQFVHVEDAFDSGSVEDAILPEHVNAVDAFVTMWVTGKLEYTVLEAEMTNTCWHTKYADGKCGEVGCPNFTAFLKED